MKKVTLLSALLLFFIGTAFAECNMPQGPIIPDGNVASQDELVAAQQAIKDFQESLVGYRTCLDDMTAALDPEAATTVEQAAAISKTYDASVDAEAALAEEFNLAVRAFKARQ